MFRVILSASIVLAGIVSTATAAFAAAFECVANKSIATSDADVLLKNVQERYSGVQGLHARFVQDSFMAALEVSEQSFGQVWFGKPGQMKWDYERPDPQTFVLRDKTIWLFQKRENQVLIDQVQDVLLSDLPVAFLLGVGNLSRDFLLERACRNAEGLVLLELRPLAKGARENLDRVLLLVDAQNLPRGVRVKDVSGNVTAITLSDIEVNPTFDSGLFVAEIPKGADINDRRQKIRG